MTGRAAVAPPSGRSPTLRLGVTGTDTGVGKTVVTCALAAALRARGRTVAAMKPVETGVSPSGPRSDVTDAARLHRAITASVGDPADAAPGVEIDDLNPLRLGEPLAPWIAAERTGRPIDVEALDAARARLERGRDVLLVEGAGGLLVPFTASLAFADLVARWSLDLVVVAANRLGAINHTLLTVREAHRRGLVVRAVVLVAPEVEDLASRTNVEAFGVLLGARGDVPRVPLVPFPRLPGAVVDDDQLPALAAAAGPLAELLSAPR